ncbi:hypothetical protein B0H14DRAFT_2652148 [Mycena olivaceomarginata]|nr:hypothetical protein B0H14DRAFT_2652148 [Mycena olivaceomarginata]
MINPGANHNNSEPEGAQKLGTLTRLWEVDYWTEKTQTRGIPARLCAPEEIMALGNRHQGAAEDFRAACRGEGASLQRGERLNIEARMTLALDAKKKDKMKDRTRARRGHGPGVQGTAVRHSEEEKCDDSVSKTIGSEAVGLLKPYKDRRRGYGCSMRKGGRERQSGNEDPKGRKTAESEPSTSSGGRRANGGIRRRAEGGSMMHRHPRPHVPMRGQNGRREPRARKTPPPPCPDAWPERRAGAEGAEGTRARDGGRDSEQTAGSGGALRAGTPPPPGPDAWPERRARAEGAEGLRTRDGGRDSERTAGFWSALPGENNPMRQHYTYVRARGMRTSRGGFEPKEGGAGPYKRAKCSLSERIEGTKSRQLVRRPACAWSGRARVAHAAPGGRRVPAEVEERSSDGVEIGVNKGAKR